MDLLLIPNAFQLYTTPPSRNVRYIVAHLSACVATVDDDVGTGRVCAGVGEEVDVSALDLLGLTIPVHGDHYNKWSQFIAVSKSAL